MFKIVELGNGRETIELLDDDGKPRYIYETGADAAESAAELTNAFGPARKFGVRPCTDGADWRARERARFDDGTYQRLPWIDEPWYFPIGNDHFAHISQEKDGMIAYTESPVKGAADRQTRVRPGRYLERYFSEVLTPEQIRRYAVQFTKTCEDNELKFAATADDIERVYTNGPSSCMAHGTSHYAGDIHPTRVYAAGDIQIAYIERDDRITARCVTWPAKKIYGRIYGDSERLSDLLIADGFCEDWDGFKGARLVRHEYGSTFVVPYVDGHSYAGDDGEFLIISGAGRDIDINRTDGLGSEDDEDRALCEHCEEYCNIDDTYTVRIGRESYREQMWCSHCAENSSVTCEATDERFHEDLIVTLHDGTAWNQFYFDDNGGTCDETGENYPDTDLRYDDETGETVCESVYEDRIVERKAEVEAEATHHTARPDTPREREAFILAGQMALPLVRAFPGTPDYLVAI